MSIEKKLFDTLADGTPVYAYTLKNTAGTTVVILNYGGTLQQLKVADRNGCFTDIIGGYDCIASYVEGDGYQGALIGRIGNRINKGKFTLDGKEYTLFINNGENHLHGGEYGFDKKIWDVISTTDSDEPALTLRYVSPDGEEGYPGTLTVTVTYTLNKENGLELHYVANTDRRTILNLTNHTYFNLAGYAHGTVLDQELWLDADSYLIADAALIPTGEICAVSGTPLDFTTQKSIGRDFDTEDPALKEAGGYDHCLNFRGGKTEKVVLRGRMYDPKSGRQMELYTNQPCVQLYSGNFLKNAAYPFKGGFAQRPQSFVCLETQHMPDSINHDNFTNCILNPEDTYDFTTEYRFSVK